MPEMMCEICPVMNEDIFLTTIRVLQTDLKWKFSKKNIYFFDLCDAHGSINIAPRKHFENFISFSNNKGTKMPEMMSKYGIRWQESQDLNVQGYFPNEYQFPAQIVRVFPYYFE